MLVTGFEPFGGAATNPSQEVVEYLQVKAAAPDWQLAVLPVSFAKAAAKIRELIATSKPDIVLMLGLAGEATKYRLESQAVNLAAARIPDNDGNQPNGVPVIISESVEQIRLGSWPVAKLFECLSRAGHDVELSADAGRYVCNATYYAALQQAGSVAECGGEYQPKIGFLHIPAKRSLLETNDLISAIVEMLATAPDKRKQKFIKSSYMVCLNDGDYDADRVQP